MRVARLAALVGLFSITATAALAAAPAAPRRTDSFSPATRFAGGATATATVTARIIRQSASVGGGRGPPAPLMAARATSVTAADGRVVPALVYDFE
jgi:hypothetical protein